MILFDSSLNEVIIIDDIKVNTTKLDGISQMTEINIILNYKYEEYVKKWFLDMFNENLYDKRKYVRDIFIKGKVDMLFSNCYPTSWDRNNMQRIELSLTCDYSEIGGNYPQLKAIYRDRKIDELLN